MLTLKEVMKHLELDQSEVERLVKKGRLDAYKIGGAYLRFKKTQVVTLRKQLGTKAGFSPTLFSRIRDFWVFNRVYLFSILLFGLVIYFLVR
ncbi:MAG TPA: helix-turn-helix domain-containing protein [Candidatus Omnitrophota bacterium]|nr:helix-turn-helix domain-containing protein [Candidatus Omnitrophota bacterium]